MFFWFIFHSILFTGPTNPVELGAVHWLRDFDEAQARSRTECKPILILFQEVPGCQTCRTYGSEVLSHPLIVEAMETYFIPLAIYNNKGGHDGDVLKKYNEPAWNNPVVRIVDAQGKDLTQRLSGNYSAAGLTDLMIQVMIKNSGVVPQYLQLLADEFTAQQRGIASATYSMYCFWSGEALFGNVNGVVKTTAGWQDGREVVKVEYDPSVISKSQLDKISNKLSCKATSPGSFKTDSTPKYYLSNHAYRVIPMTEIQKCRVNSALAENQDADIFLSPGQLAFLSAKSKKNNVSLSINEAWGN